LKNTSTLWKPKQAAAVLATAALLSACGGSETTPLHKAQGMRAAPAQGAALPASAYVDLVQKIYIAYFGRPADPGGLANFTAQMAAVGAPTDVAALPDAYAANAGLRALIDAFSFSAESAKLYPGDTTSFVNAVYDHLLNRPPAAAGLAFWVSAIDSGTLSRSLASLSIMSAALSNTSEVGKKDAALIGIKSAVANSFTTQLQGTSGVYAGADIAALARTMLGGLTANSNVTGYQAVLDAVTADMKAGTKATKPFPLLLNYMSFLSRGQAVQNTLVSGTCSGYGNGSTTVPAQTTFESKPALSVTQTETMRFSNCSPGLLTFTTLSYFDSNFTPLGSADPGFEYTVFPNAVPTLPVRVAVGDTGSYGVQALYGDSSKQTVTGRRELSYVIEADPAAVNGASAVFNLKALSYDASNVLLVTVQTRYRIGTDGSVMELSQDEQHSGDSTVRLISKMQPSALATVDTVTGTGTAAVAGKTLTVHYTGWLYDASAVNFHGAQFDSSIGKTPFSFPLGAGRVIAGFDQGLLGLKVGGKRTLIIPPNLGYGNGGTGGIPGGAGLVFDVELVGMQ
jgi:FKBP-type peptidyl-prolyl cis-trans isomerase